MKKDKTPKRDDDLVDFEYMDHDIHLQGKISRRSEKVLYLLMSISAVLIIIGFIMMLTFENGIINFIGIILSLVGGFGIIFIAPFVASFF